MPVPNEIEDLSALEYQMMGYGDMLRLYVAPDFSQMYSELSLLDQETGNTNRPGKTSWLAMHAPEGGYDNLLNRVSIPWGGSEAFKPGVLYFLTLDPATLAPPSGSAPGPARLVL